LKISHRHPVAGKTFKGFTMKLETAGIAGTVISVKCDARIAGQPLRTLRPISRAPVKAVICRWRIPPYTAGERLRLLAVEAHLSNGRAFYRPSKGPSWIVKERQTRR
jgi:hypothetical protein